MSNCTINKTKKIKWSINKIPKILNSYLSEPNEIAGMFPIDFNKKETLDITVKYGDKSSVSAPTAIANYHTHPAHCYLGEKTVWGFPSGEDIRETILFCFKGSIAHLVIAVEGTYVIQVSQDIINKLQGLDLSETNSSEFLPKGILNNNESPEDFVRGLIIRLIEIYFRTTHAFRTLEFIEKHQKISPEDYIEYCNQFTFGKLFQSKKQMDKCGRFNCSNFWAFENNKLKRYSIENYIKNYEYEENLLIVKRDGARGEPEYLISDYIEKYGLDVIKKLGNTFNNSPWFTVKFFPHYIKTKPYGHLSNDIKTLVLKKLANKEPVDITIMDKPYFVYYDMSGSCDHKDTKSLLSTSTSNTSTRDSSRDSKSSRSSKDSRKSPDKENIETNQKYPDYILIGSKNCDFCREAKDLLDKKRIKYHYVHDDNISTAIDKGNVLIRKLNKQGYSFGKVDSIPVLLPLLKKQ